MKIIDSNSFGNRLRRLRRAARLSQEQLAELLDVTGETILDFELDRELPGPVMLSRIAEVFDRPLATWQNPGGLFGRAAGARPDGDAGRHAPDRNTSDEDPRLVQIREGLLKLIHQANDPTFEELAHIDMFARLLAQEEKHCLLD